MRQTIGQYCFSMALYSYVKKLNIYSLLIICVAVIDMCKKLEHLLICYNF